MHKKVKDFSEKERMVAEILLNSLSADNVDHLYNICLMQQTVRSQNAIYPIDKLPIKNKLVLSIHYQVSRTEPIEAVIKDELIQSFSKGSL